MTQQDLTKLEIIVSSAKHVLLLQPDHPDLDSLGAAVALKTAINKLGKEATIFCPKPLRGSNAYLFNEEVRDIISDFDATILVDTPSEKMISISLANYKQEFKKHPFVVIDHHPEIEGHFKFADLKIIEEKEPAAASLVFKIITKLKWEVSKESGRALLLAYLYDTRKLMIGKVKADTLRDVAGILELSKVSIAEVNQEYDMAFGIKPETYKKKARLIRNVKYYKNHQIAVYSIPKRLNKWLRTRGSLSEFMKYELQTLRGVLISVGLNEGKAIVGITMRANIPIANKVAAEFGGGGHPLAAGARVKGVSSARKVRKMIVPVIEKEIEKYVKEHPNDPALQHIN